MSLEQVEDQHSHRILQNRAQRQASALYEGILVQWTFLNCFVCSVTWHLDNSDIRTGPVKSNSLSFYCIQFLSYHIYSCMACTFFLEILHCGGLTWGCLMATYWSLKLRSDCYANKCNHWRLTMNTFTVADLFFGHGLVPSCSGLREWISTWVCS